MARFQRTVDIWSLEPEQIARLQPGQWVTAGGARGVFCGVRDSGTVVVTLLNRFEAGDMPPELPFEIDVEELAPAA